MRTQLLVTAIVLGLVGLANAATIQFDAATKGVDGVSDLTWTDGDYTDAPAAYIKLIVDNAKGKSNVSAEAWAMPFTGPATALQIAPLLPTNEQSPWYRAGDVGMGSVVKDADGVEWVMNVYRTLRTPDPAQPTKRELVWGIGFFTVAVDECEIPLQEIRDAVPSGVVWNATIVLPGANPFSSPASATGLLGGLEVTVQDSDPRPQLAMVPEPGVLTLLAVGAFGTLAAKRRLKEKVNGGSPIRDV